MVKEPLQRKRTIIYRRRRTLDHSCLVAGGILILGILFLLAMPVVALLMEPDLFNEDIPIEDVRPATFIEQAIGAFLFFGGLAIVLFGLFAFLTLL